ncbi:unnamed protein product [Gordionus sp. m RMFG-2023]
MLMASAPYPPPPYPYNDNKPDQYTNIYPPTIPPIQPSYLQDNQADQYVPHNASSYKPYPIQNVPQPIIYIQGPPQHAVIVDAMAHRPIVPKATVITTTKKSGVNHCIHAIITIFFFPWIIVWIILCCLDSKKKKQTTVIKI